MIITGVASKILERIDRLVYLDADWPDPGQSLFDVLKLSGLGPEVAIPGLEPSPGVCGKNPIRPGKSEVPEKVFLFAAPKVTSPSSGTL